MRKRWILYLLCAVMIHWLVGMAAAESEEYGTKTSRLSADEVAVCNIIQQQIDAGDALSVAYMLVEGEMPHTVYEHLCQTDMEVLDEVLANAMLDMGSKGDIERIVKLRLDGYVSDACFMRYWDLLEYELPDFSGREEHTELDLYLLHELKGSYVRDEYAISGFQNLRAAGLLNDDIHAELVKALGFDYTDTQYLDQHGIAPLRELNTDERAVYEAILQYIDEGDCQSVVQLMLSGEATPAVYDFLMREDKELVDFVIADGMAALEAVGDYEGIVTLRVQGFVSNECFEYYWRAMDDAPPQIEREANNTMDVDAYLLYELELICQRDEQNREIVRKVWEAGLIDQEIYEAVIGR